MSKLKKKRPIEFVQDIYDRAPGGIAEIAYKLGCHMRTIERWPAHGISERYWPGLYEHYDVMPIDCFHINSKLRKYYNSPKR